MATYKPFKTTVDADFACQSLPVSVGQSLGGDPAMGIAVMDHPHLGRAISLLLSAPDEVTLIGHLTGPQSIALRQRLLEAERALGPWGRA